MGIISSDDVKLREGNDELGALLEQSAFAFDEGTCVAGKMIGVGIDGLTELNSP